MALTLVTDGSVTLDGTEQTLTTQTTTAVYSFGIDCGAMVNGDSIEIKIKTKMRSGGTSRIAYYATYNNIQAEPNKYSVPLPINVEIVVTIKKLTGANNAHPWALYSY